ncbi:hypothetical protein B566_EDAN017290 [Ephemera danica]|nr:hypothetical protein B566_EDAN017290 [Ephemera danica]
MAVLELCVVAVSVFLVVIKVRHKLFAGRCTSKARMDGKTVIVTGADTDEIVRLSGNKDVHLLPLNLESLSSVRNFVQLVKQRTSKLHVLVNNAGVGMMPNCVSEDGLQITMQINHFGPMLLTLLLIGQSHRGRPADHHANQPLRTHAAHSVAISRTEDVLQITLQINHFGPMLLTLLLLGQSHRGRPADHHANQPLRTHDAHSVAISRTEDGLQITLQINHFGLMLLTLLLIGVTCNSVHPGYVPTVIYDTVPCIVARLSFKFALKLSCKV